MILNWSIDLCIVKVLNEYKEHEFGQLLTLHLLFIMSEIILLNTDVPYSTSLSFEESVSMSHNPSATSVKAFMNFLCSVWLMAFKP